MRLGIGRKGRDVYNALALSNCNMATANKRGKEIVAIRTGSGVRVVKGFTDPTVMRKLNPSDEDLFWNAIDDFDQGGRS